MYTRELAMRIALSIAGCLVISLLFGIWFDTEESPLEGAGLSPDMLRAYGTYALEKQMELLLHHQENEAVASYMLTHIARHGEKAYLTLLPFLKGEKEGLDRDLAGQGMMWIHGWGYDLKNTEAQEILESMLVQSSVRYWLRTAVQEIRSKPAGHSRSAMEGNDSLILHMILQR